MIRLIKRPAAGLATSLIADSGSGQAGAEVPRYRIIVVGVVIKVDPLEQRVGQLEQLPLVEPGLSEGWLEVAQPELL